MCKKLGVRAKQAAALLTANTKYLSHMMEKGIKGSFDAVDAWYAEVFKSKGLLGELMIQNPSTIPFVLNTLKWAFSSENEESANWMARIYANLGASLQQAGLGHVLCDWLVSAAAGATAGLPSLLKCLEIHPGTGDAVYGVIIQFAEGKLHEVFHKHLPRLVGPEEWMGLLEGLLPLLQSTRTSKGEAVLGGSAQLVHALAGLTVQFGDSDNTDECRITAFQLLARLWSDCGEDLTQQRSSLDLSLEVWKKGTRSSNPRLAQEAQNHLFLLLDLMGGISYTDGVSAAYRTLVLIMLELPAGDPLQASLSQQLAERLRKNSHLSPAIVVEPLVKQVGAEGASAADVDFIAVIASHGKLSRQHGDMLIECLGGAWPSLEGSEARTTAGDTITSLVGRFKGDQGMPQAVAGASTGILEAFSGRAVGSLQAEAVELLQRVAQVGGTSAQSAVAGSVEKAIRKAGGDDKLEEFLAKLGGPSKASQKQGGEGLSAKEPKAPSEPKSRKASAARSRQATEAFDKTDAPEKPRGRSKGRDSEIRDPREERAERETAGTESRESRGRSRHRPEPIKTEPKPGRASMKEQMMADPRKERKPKKERRKTTEEAAAPKEVAKFKREKVARSPSPAATKKKPEWAIEPSKEWEALSEEEKAARKKGQQRLRAKRLDELKQIKQKREQDAESKKRRELEQRARSADLKEKLAQNRIRDYERAQQARQEHEKQAREEALAEAADADRDEDVVRAPKSAAPEKASKVPFYLREDPREEIIETCMNKYPHEHRLPARQVCELFLDIVDEAIDPVGARQLVIITIYGHMCYN